MTKQFNVQSENRKKSGGAYETLRKIPFPTLDMIELALRMHRGSITDAAEELSVEPPMLRRKINATPSLLKVCKDIKEQQVDKAEQALYDLVDDKNPQATIFVLKTLGKERGFTEKSTVELELGDRARSAAALVESMRNGAKQLTQSEDDDVIDVEGTIIDAEEAGST